jgi:ElaA protein
VTIAATAAPAEEHRLAALWADMDDLSPTRLHAVLRLRVDVFVVEQACAYAEIDGLDPLARHLLVEDADSGQLAAYLRLLPPEAGGGVRLGRIVIAPARRGIGLGGYLMEEGLAEAARAFPGCDVELSAQAHLLKFYRSHGFEAVSETYLEDGIPHIDMRKAAASPAAVQTRTGPIHP